MIPSLLTMLGKPGGGGGVDTVWFEDAVPAGVTTFTDNDLWDWVSSSPAPFSGSLCHRHAVASGTHQHYFTGATTDFSVSAGEKMICYVYIDPTDTPTEIMLQWNDGSWDHRAYWGADSIPYGSGENAAHHYMGVLPATGQWVRLEIPASAVNLEGASIDGMAFTIYDGRASWDRAGKTT